MSSGEESSQRRLIRLLLHRRKVHHRLKGIDQHQYRGQLTGALGSVKQKKVRSHSATIEIKQIGTTMRAKILLQ